MKPYPLFGSLGSTAAAAAVCPAHLLDSVEKTIASVKDQQENPVFQRFQ